MNMTTTQLSKQDYLKKYMSDGDKKKKKKKKVTQNSIIKSKIIDDDIDLKNMKAIDSDELEIYDLAEEAPQIVGIVDERPEEVRLMSQYRGSKKWKIVADEFGIEEVKVTAIGEEKKSGDSFEQNEKLNGSEKSDTVEGKKVGESSGTMKAEGDGSRKRFDDSDASPPRKIEIEKSDSDASPPRKSKKHYDSDKTPPRKHRKKKQSPPVKIKKEKYDSDMSPPRRNKKQKDSDILRRKIKRENSDSDASPPRRSGGKYDSDQSPPRRVKKEKQDTSRKKYDSDDSPHGKARKNKSDSDSSPPRSSRKHKGNSISGRRENRSSRISPERLERRESGKGSSKSNGSSSVTKKKDEGSSFREDVKLKNTLGGKKSGLQNAEELRKEIEELKEREKEMKETASGKNEAVVVRDRKTGRRIDPKEEARKKREKEEKEAEKIAQYAVWGKGVKQVEDCQDKLKDDLYEMSKPLARYADDKDLDNMLRNKEWDGDPMLEYMRKKKKKEREDSGDGKPQYEGAYMPNRYGIRPGHRWDGVDRSNGYEKKWFEEQNAKKAREEEAFKWSTADIKEAMQAVETRAELAKEKLQNLTAHGENLVNNLTGKDKVDSPKKEEEEQKEKSSPEEEIVDIDLKDPEVNEAAVKIQAAFRGHKTRKNMKQEDSEPKQNFEEEFSPDDKELCDAATKIQASFRGHLARKLVPRKEEAEELSKELQKLDAKAAGGEEEELDIDLNDPELQVAATKIQASFRGHRVRKDKPAKSDQ